MTEIEVIRIIRVHLEGLFPKVCSNCNNRFETYRDYLLSTKPLGSPTSFDAQMGDWHPAEPAESMSFANCPCGNTLALSSAGMPLLQLWSLMNWARVETKKRHQTLEQLLIHLRVEIKQQVLMAPQN
jgi:hypothetical protein